MMDEDRAFTLMMEALDGELDPREQQELDRLLAQQPDLLREWSALQHVDALFRAAPPIAVPVNFAARTLARLPDPRRRRLFLSAFFVLLFVGGLLPVLLGVIFFMPATAGALGQTVGALFEVLRVLLAGIFSSARGILLNQPYVFGWLSLMVVAVGAWVSVYSQLLNTPQPAAVRASAGPRR